MDVVAGPDAYRDLPRLLSLAEGGEEAVNTQLSLDETYADIAPVRRAGGGHAAFVSIMRGCDNMCSYCVVPFTRGRERSRDADSVVDEVRRLFEVEGRAWGAVQSVVEGKEVLYVEKNPDENSTKDEL